MPAKLAKSVSITRMDDVDENGRFKDSIQAVIYSLQKDHTDEKSVEGSNAASIESAPQVSKAATPEPSLKSNDNHSQADDNVSVASQKSVPVDNRPWSSRMDDIVQNSRKLLNEAGGFSEHETFALTSGILLLTGSGSRTVNGGTSFPATSESIADAAPSIESCFVSLFNPKQSGSLAYCAEVNVSGHQAPKGHEAALDPSLGACCIFPNQSKGDNNKVRESRKEVVAVLQTTVKSDNRHGLVIRLADAETGNKLYEVCFVVPTQPLPASRVSDSLLAEVTPANVTKT
jgi:hypothetical protein